MVDFLLRRHRSETLLSNVLRTALIERELYSTMSLVFDLLAKSLAKAYREGRTKKSSKSFPKIVESDDPDNAPLDDEGADITAFKTANYWHQFINTSKTTKSDKPIKAVLPPLDNLSEEESQGSSSESDQGAEVPGTPGPPGIKLKTIQQALPPLIEPPKYNAVDEKPKMRAEEVFIDEDDFYTEVLLKVEETESLKGTLNTKYLVAMVVEYIKCLDFEHIKIKSFLYEFIINLLVRNNKYYQLHQFLQYHVINDSMHVACQLLSLGETYPPCYQLALDMFKRLKCPQHIMEIFLTRGHVMQALSFVLKTYKEQPVKIEPARFLEAAMKSEDAPIFWTIFNFFVSKGLISKREAIYIQKYEQLFVVQDQLPPF